MLRSGPRIPEDEEGAREWYRNPYLSDLPSEPPKPKGGRPRVSDRAALTRILFVLKTGIPWEYLPAELSSSNGH